MLRQQIRPDLRIHGVVHYDKTPLPPNGELIYYSKFGLLTEVSIVIPADMSMVWNIRAPTKSDLDDLAKRVTKCFE